MDNRSIIVSPIHDYQDLLNSIQNKRQLIAAVLQVEKNIDKVRKELLSQINVYANEYQDNDRAERLFFLHLNRSKRIEDTTISDLINKINDIKYDLNYELNHLDLTEFTNIKSKLVAIYSALQIMIVKMCNIINDRSITHTEPANNGEKRGQKYILCVLNALPNNSNNTTHRAEIENDNSESDHDSDQSNEYKSDSSESSIEENHQINVKRRSI